MTDKELMKQAPAYLEGDVVGPCVCGSWPGGKCLKCPWVELTDEQIHNTAGYQETREMYSFARAIEDKLKEKNG